VIILGIFARENVYLGARWISPDSNSRTEDAFRLYTNYDGEGSSVQGDSVAAHISDMDEVEGFAFVYPSKSMYYVVLVNQRGDGTVPVTVNLSSATQNGTVLFYSFSESQRLGLSGKSQVVGGKLTVNLPAWSATLAVISRQ